MGPKFIFAWDKQEYPPCPTHLLTPRNTQGELSRRVLLYQTAMHLRKAAAVKFPLKRKRSSTGGSLHWPLDQAGAKGKAVQCNEHRPIKGCSRCRGSGLRCVCAPETFWCPESTLPHGALRLLFLSFSFFFFFPKCNPIPREKHIRSHETRPRETTSQWPVGTVDVGLRILRGGLRGRLWVDLITLDK